MKTLSWMCDHTKDIRLEMKYPLQSGRVLDGGQDERGETEMV